ncbi:uncharacterized protein LOC116349384 [Contarinia nasturtii]|uniref:uncharacterized protein LOC116349384 n=1 Tax=Contarinia nasturtii TaxID=265458 RepID=UPI0012D3EE12|nr:uncharacterized protein LOC116349384 [Contarinia nasturtii]
MYQKLLFICFLSIFLFKTDTLAATADELFSDIPRAYLERLIGNLDGLTFDIEQQEIVEVPSIKFKIQVRPGGSSTTTSPSSPSSTTPSSASSKRMSPSSTSKMPDMKSSTTPMPTTSTPSLIRN